MIRLSEGDSANMQYYGLLGLMPMGTTTYSSLSTSDDLILHDNQGGDIIITNYSTSPVAAFAHGTAIRLATSGNLTQRPATPSLPHDLERLTINGNGNVGINLPPNTTGLDSSMDQLQVGGGSIVLPGEMDPLPGLSIYGGNRFEGMLQPVGDTGMYPFDLRYIGFNYAIDHSNPASTRVFRMARTSSSVISFGDGDGGSIDLADYPYNSSLGLNNFQLPSHFHFMGSKGLEVWCAPNDTDVYHHLFDCWVPGFPGYNWQVGGDSLRNVNGLFIHHTPVLIYDVANDQSVPNFTNFTNVRPRIGDGLTWMLAVDGPALFKEAFVRDTVWSDFVFQPDYKLPSLAEVESYTNANHHLPGIPSAEEIKETGIDLGATDAKLLQKIEELTKYVIEQNHKIEALDAEVKELKNQKEK
jgi:hypothetical protein